MEKYKGLEYLLGKINQNIKDIGNKIKCMEKVVLFFLQVKSMMDNVLKMKNMGKEFTLTNKELFLMVIGYMENCMDNEN